MGGTAEISKRDVEGVANLTSDSSVEGTAMDEDEDEEETDADEVD